MSFAIYAIYQSFVSIYLLQLLIKLEQRTQDVILRTNAKVQGCLHPRRGGFKYLFLKSHQAETLL